MINFLQVNVGVGRAAQDLALATTVKLNADFLLLSEQNRSGTEPDGWFPDSQGRSAVVVKSQIPVNQVGPHESGLRWTEVPGLRVYSSTGRLLCPASWQETSMPSRGSGAALRMTREG